MKKIMTGKDDAQAFPKNMKTANVNVIPHSKTLVHVPVQGSSTIWGGAGELTVAQGD